MPTPWIDRLPSRPDQKATHYDVVGTWDGMRGKVVFRVAQGSSTPGYVGWLTRGSNVQRTEMIDGASVSHHSWSAHGTFEGAQPIPRVKEPEYVTWAEAKEALFAATADAVAAAQADR